MDTACIADLLHPFLTGALNTGQLAQISTYIDLLLRWNARLNLTAIRTPEEIVSRHFGESLFLASHLFAGAEATPELRVIDLGSGAGFPALPLKIWASQVHLSLIESNHKKATFLREVIRALALANVTVYAERAEKLLAEVKLPENEIGLADIVTLRAVEKFNQALLLAEGFLGPSGRLALLISSAQLPQAKLLTNKSLGLMNEPLGPMKWTTHAIPQSHQRILAIGEHDRKVGY